MFTFQYGATVRNSEKGEILIDLQNRLVVAPSLSEAEALVRYAILQAYGIEAWASIHVFHTLGAPEAPAAAPEQQVTHDVQHYPAETAVPSSAPVELADSPYVF